MNSYKPDVDFNPNVGRIRDSSSDAFYKQMMEDCKKPCSKCGKDMILDDLRHVHRLDWLCPKCFKGSKYDKKRKENTYHKKLRKKMAKRTHCIHGHPWVEGNIYRTVDREFCVICKRNSQKKYNKKIRLLGL